jgi:hypothetical protein
MGLKQGEAMSLSFKRAKRAADALKTWRFPWGWLSETECPGIAAALREQAIRQLAFFEFCSASRHSSLSSSSFFSRPSSSSPSSPVDEAEAHCRITQNGACAPSEESNFEAQKSYHNGSANWHQPPSAISSHQARSQSLLNGLSIITFRKSGPWGRTKHSPFPGGEEWRQSVWFGQATWALQSAALVHSEPAAEAITALMEKQVRVMAECCTTVPLKETPNFRKRSNLLFVVYYLFLFGYYDHFHSF